jgi:tetrahydromethanopterin S-methyltransferase subunit G
MDKKLKKAINKIMKRLDRVDKELGNICLELLDIDEANK